MKKLLTRAFLLLVCAPFANLSIAAEIIIPSIPGLGVTRGESVPIRDAESAIVHQFEDGRIVVMGKDCGVWSHDHGKSWTRGPKGPDDKTTINLGNKEVLSVRRTSTKAKDGTYSLSQRRSLDDWRTVTEETAPLDTPHATTAGGDAGDQHEGLLMHHGAVQLPSGELVATMFGNYQGDRTPAAGYPEELGLFKYRTVVVFSSDKGKSWGRPVTVAYEKQLARGADPDSSVQTTAIVPAVTQEGFCEADLTRAADGTLVCAMRSGGRIGIKRAPIFPTPLYVSRSTDDGRSWSAPVPIADRGVCPYLVTLKNGVIVCSYARPGGWLIFSDDHGETWKGSFQICASDSYCNVIEVESNRILAIYYDRRPDPANNDRNNSVEYWGTFFSVERR